MDNSEQDIWKDSRFSHLVSDPRFKQLPKSQRKVKIDKRFESMFSDDKFKVKYTTDKYGRKLNKTSTEDLKKYYEINSSDEEAEEQERKDEEQEIAKDEAPGVNDELEASEGLPANILKKLESGVDYARGEGRLLTDSSSDEESSEDEDELYIEHVWGELDNDAPRTEESTRRLAACNMDWDRIRASDIMVLCNSFLPPGGSILSVKIYASDFGKERMAEEDVHGPTELKLDNMKNEQISDDEKSGDDLIEDQDSDAEEGDDYQTEKLRQYQLNRLKYYYAVIECDTVATADKLYKECDGLEYESTATKLDLRFIPEDTKFDDDEPNDVCTEVPDLGKYKPRLFTTTALQQAKVELTWDETNLERREISDKLCSGKIDEVADADIRKFVAYSSEEEVEDGLKNESKDEESEDDVEKPKESINKYKALLAEINKKEEDKKKSKYEMEMSWTINAKDKKKEKLDQKQNPNVNPFEKILDKKREKNKKRKEERKKKAKGNTGEDDYSSDDVPDGIDLHDPYFAEEFTNNEFAPSKKSSKKDRKKSKSSKIGSDGENDSEEEGSKSKQLELLLDDGEDDKQHFSLKKIQDAESETKSKKRRKKLKKSRHEIEAAKSNMEDDFAVNVKDDRFKNLYTSHLFNIDPTDSHFKKTKGMEALIQEKLKRRTTEGSDRKSATGADGQEGSGESPMKRPKKSVENSLLIKSLKRKIKNNISR